MTVPENHISHERVPGRCIHGLRLSREWTPEQPGRQGNLGAVFMPQARFARAGRNSIDRSGVNVPHHASLRRHVLLCNHLSQNGEIPFTARVAARSFDDFEGASRHDSEEFMGVPARRMVLHSEFREPVTKEPGDRWDSRPGHWVVGARPKETGAL